MAGQVRRWKDRCRAGFLCAIASTDDSTFRLEEFLYDPITMVQGRRPPVSYHSGHAQPSHTLYQPFFKTLRRSPCAILGRSLLRLFAFPVLTFIFSPLTPLFTALLLRFHPFQNSLSTSTLPVSQPDGKDDDDDDDDDDLLVFASGLWCAPCFPYLLFPSFASPIVLRALRTHLPIPSQPRLSSLFRDHCVCCVMCGVGLAV